MVGDLKTLGCASGLTGAATQSCSVLSLFSPSLPDLASVGWIWSRPAGMPPVCAASCACVCLTCSRYCLTYAACIEKWMPVLVSSLDDVTSATTSALHCAARPALPAKGNFGGALDYLAGRSSTLRATCHSQKSSCIFPSMLLLVLLLPHMVVIKSGIILHKADVD